MGRETGDDGDVADRRLVGAEVSKAEKVREDDGYDTNPDRRDLPAREKDPSQSRRAGAG